MPPRHPPPVEAIPPAPPDGDDPGVLVLPSTRSAPAPAPSVPPPRHDEVALSAAVHEIQNVMASVLGWVQVAREEGSPETVARALPIIERGVRRAAEMVGALADPDAVLRVRDVTFDLRLVVAEVFELLEARCRAKGVGLRVLRSSGVSAPAPLLVRGDPTRVAQVLTNFVLNACKAVASHRPPGAGMVELSTDTYPAEGRIGVTVRDNGPGMDAETRARAFDPYFTTAAGAHDGLQGTGRGLGLAVSRSLAEAMSARIEVHSEPGQGAEVTLLLRRASRPSEPALSPITDGGGDAKLPLGLRVLVVDDEPTIRELLEVALSLRGARVVAVPDLRGARKALTRGEAEVALIDEGLGDDQSGASFLAEMSVSWPDVGRVLMTGASSIDHMREVPCAAFVRKPFLLDDIVRALAIAHGAH
ncbi:MAG: ATP-binding protein [Polyangiales bacterium]